MGTLGREIIACQKEGTTDELPSYPQEGLTALFPDILNLIAICLPTNEQLRVSTLARSTRTIAPQACVLRVLDGAPKDDEVMALMRLVSRGQGSRTIAMRGAGAHQALSRAVHLKHGLLCHVKGLSCACSEYGCCGAYATELTAPLMETLTELRLDGLECGLRDECHLADTLPRVLEGGQWQRLQTLKIHGQWTGLPAMVRQAFYGRGDGAAPLKTLDLYFKFELDNETTPHDLLLAPSLAQLESLHLHAQDAATVVANYLEAPGGRDNLLHLTVSCYSQDCIWSSWGDIDDDSSERLFVALRQGAARTLKTLEVHRLTGHWDALACLYESEPPVPVELNFAHLERLVVKHCFLSVAVVLELLHHVPVLFPRLKELMVEQVVVDAMHGRAFQSLLREAPELFPNLRIGVSLRDMTLIEEHVKRVTELLQSPTVISLSRLHNLHCRGGLGLCLEFARALSGERLGSKLAHCGVSFPDLSSEELAQVKVELKRLRAEGAWPLDPWNSYFNLWYYEL